MSEGGRRSTPTRLSVAIVSKPSKQTVKTRDIEVSVCSLSW